MNEQKNQRDGISDKILLVPHKITKEQEELLLTELAWIFYDLSCQFRNQSSTTEEHHFEGLKNRRSGNE